MKLVITGALGHIGSRLIRVLPALIPNVKIVMIDNLSTQRYTSLFDLPKADYRFREADILSADLTHLFEGADAVVHLAAITDAASSLGRKDEVDQVNFHGTHRVAEACVATGAAVLFASTTSVYGTHSEVVSEDCPPDQLRPQSPYAESKLRAERLLRELSGARGLSSIICRFGTIFGTSPGMRFHTAVNRFVWQACLGLPLSVWTTALNQRRPYLDLGDAVRAIAFILQHRQFDNGVYNVVTENATVGEIVNILRGHVTGLDVQLVDSPIMNQLSYHVSRVKFESLGFCFEGTLTKGIAESVRLLRNAFHEGNSLDGLCS